MRARGTSCPGIDVEEQIKDHHRGCAEGRDTMRHIIQYGLLATLACLNLAVGRANDFPNKPITVMVGLAAGGITDVTTRLYSEVMTRNLGIAR